MRPRSVVDGNQSTPIRATPAQRGSLRPVWSSSGPTKTDGISLSQAACARQGVWSSHTANKRRACSHLLPQPSLRRFVWPSPPFGNAIPRPAATVAWHVPHLHVVCQSVLCVMPQATSRPCDGCSRAVRPRTPIEPGDSPACLFGFSKRSSCAFRHTCGNEEPAVMRYSPISVSMSPRCSRLGGAGNGLARQRTAT